MSKRLVITEKLVRDKIPDIIRKKGETAHTRRASGTDLLRLLVAKLHEEAAEFGRDFTLYELADVQEVVDALADFFSWSKADVKRIQARKRRERGGFKNAVVLRTNKVIDE